MAGKGFFAVIICLFSFCGQPFEVLNSTSQKYSPGRKENSPGINYKVMVVTKKSSNKLSFNNVVVDGKQLRIKIQDTNKKFIKEFNKGDTITLSATYVGAPIDKLKASKTMGKLLLDYQFKKKEGVAVVESKELVEKHFK